ncbi:hypothetical protein GCM10010272_30840 [Streptomyces lateritius]|nr:hypothetical protein GCM10010272_30840 [Streptomyces lateritius]
MCTGSGAHGLAHALDSRSGKACVYGGHDGPGTARSSAAAVHGDFLAALLGAARMEHERKNVPEPAQAGRSRLNSPISRDIADIARQAPSRHQTGRVLPGPCPDGALVVRLGRPRYRVPVPPSPGCCDERSSSPGWKTWMFTPWVVRAVGPG